MAITRYPGLIDIHVHLRDPGATQKEDFHSGTRAAVKGGFTYILDMPNNPTCPTITIDRLKEKISLAKQKSLCDIGFHYGTDGKNMDSFPRVWKNPHVFGLKIYCGKTTGELLIDNPDVLEHTIAAWKSEKPVLVHAEGDMLKLCIELASAYSRRLHVCHISQINDIELLQRAKSRKQLITAGVTPHHLFLTKNDVRRLGNYATVKPQVGDENTRLALWEALSDGTIDIIESDHAPHTRQEKACSAPSAGVPGLETTLGLLLRAKIAKKLTREQIVDFLYTNPKNIFSIPDQTDTYIELDEQKPYIAGVQGYETKCGWSPFDGWQLFGKVEAVILRGKPLVQNGVIV
jgi:carbamoyl-phosphate synthase/aspartate carbamoyltransferase/dihydroorotase